MDSCHPVGEERELFKQIGRREPSRSLMATRSHSLGYICGRVLLVLLAGALGVAVALGTSAFVGSG